MMKMYIADSRFQFVQTLDDGLDQTADVCIAWQKSTGMLIFDSCKQLRL